MLGGKLGPSAVLAVIARHTPAEEPIPSYAVLWKAMKAFERANPDLVAMARHGALYWRDVFDIALSHGVLPAGLCLSIDSTVADVWCRVFSLKRKMWMAVRPVLTVVEDTGSRAFLGFNLSLLPIDSGIITATFIRAINADAQAEVHPGLPSVGIPYEVAIDKGAEHQARFRRLLDQLQIHVRGRNDDPRGQAHIERLIETVTTEVLRPMQGSSSNMSVFDPYLPPEGDTKRSPLALPWNKPKCELPISSLPTLEMLEERIWAWATVYNQRPHSELELNLDELHRMLTVASTLGVPLGVADDYVLKGAA